MQDETTDLVEIEVDRIGLKRKMGRKVNSAEGLPLTEENSHTALAFVLLVHVD